MEELEFKLKVLANRFYVDEPFEYNEDVENVSDEEYDAMVDEWEAATGRSVKELVNWGSDNQRFQPACQLAGLPKDKYFKDEIKESIYRDNKGDDFYVTYKYDGCAISAYYTEGGRLSKIMGTPDEQWGFLRTGKMFKLFPRMLPTPLRGKVRALYGEFLVNAAEFGELARNKANGLCNSKYIEDEINKYGIIRIYYSNFWNEPSTTEEKYYSVKETLEQLPTITDEEGNIRFMSAEFLNKEDITAQTVIKEKVGNYQLQVDGYVVYSTKKGRFGYKLYYTESEIVTVTGVEWNYKEENGSYAPVLLFDTITLNGKRISKCATGGAPNLINSKMGIGSEVEVVLSGSTIPKVNRVIKGSEEFNFPTCECGTKLNAYHVLGSVLKCPNQRCIRKFNKLNEEYLNALNGRTLEEYVNNVDNFVFFRTLKIDRFDPESKFRGNKKDFLSEVHCLIDEPSVSRLLDIFSHYFKISDLMWKNALINASSVINAIENFK